MADKLLDLLFDPWSVLAFVLVWRHMHNELCVAVDRIFENGSILISLGFD